MNDYLQPASDGSRRVAAIACIPAALTAAGMCVLVVADIVRTGEFEHNGKPFWVGAVVCGLIAVALGYASVRLWEASSSTGMTRLPVWFIEGFGVLFLVGILIVKLNEPLGLFGGSTVGLGVAVAMVLVRRAIRRRSAIGLVEHPAGKHE